MARPFGRALGYFPRVRAQWWRGMATIPLGSGLPIVWLWMVREVIDGLEQGTMGHGERALWCAGIMALVLLSAVAKFYMRYWITGASRDFERIYRQDLFAHLMRLSPRDLSGVRTGDVMSRSVADIEAVRMLLGPAVMYNAQAVIVVPMALIAMALIDAELMLIMLVPFVGLATIIKVAAGPTQRWSQAAQEHLADVSTAAQEAFSGVRVVKAFAGEPRAGTTFRGMGRRLMRANLNLAVLRGVTSSGITGVKELGVMAILLVGGWHAIEARLSTADLVFFISMLNYALWPLIAIGWMLGMYHRAKAGYERLEELFAIQPSVAPAEQPVTPESVRGELEVKGLTFGWDDGATVLHDVDLHVPAGGTVGITGRTGSGKSTLVQLLTRLVEPPPGTVHLDGVDVRELDPTYLRRSVSVVPQDTFLFSESIEDNIAFAGEHVDRARVEEAARRAEVHDDILGFSHGYDEELGERGVTLSGGQRQRTAIARALAADPPVVVLDDCLSAVDSVTEQQILKNLRETLAGRTAVIVSHRVNALQLADTIVVLDEGRVVERGSHAELLERGGLYAEIAERQAIEEEIEAL